MSWSVNVIGTSTKVAEYLDNYSNSLSGQSLEEYNEAKVHLIGLVNQMVTPTEGFGSLVSLTASGHANFTDGKKTLGNCFVKLDQFYGNLAL